MDSVDSRETKLVRGGKIEAVKRQEPKPDPEPESGDIRTAVATAIEALRRQISTTDGVKGTVTDLIRLLQLQKELEGDKPRHVAARWVEECQTSQNLNEE